MTYVVLKGYLYDLIDCVRKARGSNGTGESIQKRQFFSILSIILVLVSYPGSASPFFRDELLAPVLHFVSVDRGERGSAGKGLYHERSKEVNLLQIYNMDSSNAMELDPVVTNLVCVPKKRNLSISFSFFEVSKKGVETHGNS
jgi:hypothetical protein